MTFVGRRTPGPSRRVFCRRCTWRDKTRQRRPPVVHPWRSCTARLHYVRTTLAREIQFMLMLIFFLLVREILPGQLAKRAVFKDKVSSRFLFRLPRIPCLSSARFVVCNGYDSEPCLQNTSRRWMYAPVDSRPMPDTFGHHVRLSLSSCRFLCVDGLTVRVRPTHSTRVTRTRLST